MASGIPVHTLAIVRSEKRFSEIGREVKVVNTKLFTQIHERFLIRHGIVEFVNFAFRRDENDD